ncbi:MAG: S8 family serine peptidase, partial [Bacteroidota bacterium]
MKKYLSLLTLYLGLLLQLFAQPAVEYPEQYEALYSYYEEFVRLQMQEYAYDYGIPAGERIRFAASAESLSEGSWPTDFHQTKQNAGWISEHGQRKVAVFVLDTGAGFSNSRLARAWWKGKEQVFTGEATRIDVQGHSTHCAGIIAGVDPDKPIGLAEELVKKDLLKIIPYKVLNDNGFAYTNWIVAGIEAA